MIKFSRECLRRRRRRRSARRARRARPRRTPIEIPALAPLERWFEWVSWWDVLEKALGVEVIV